LQDFWSKTWLSDQVPTFDDQYIPTALQGVECVEVNSTFATRRFVLIHPVDGHLQSLDVKDYFVWDCIDGHKNLAHIKQEYYNKFKVLPTQRIIEIVRGWYEEGYFIDQPTDWKVSREVYSGWWGVRIPAGLFRVTCGSVFSLLVNKFVAYAMLMLTVVGLSVLLSQEGPMFLHRPFQSLSAPNLLGLGLLGVYLSAALKMFFRLGGLYRGGAYKNDKVIFGGWWIFPGIMIGEQGLILKPQENLIVLRLIEWLTPLFVTVICCFLAFYLAPLSFKSGLLAIALGSSMSFTLGSCPFLRNSWVKCLEAYAQGVRVRELRAAYAHNALVFIEDYGQQALLIVKVHMGSIVAWIVVGSSFLLYTMLRTSDVLGVWGRSAMGLGDAASTFWQMMLYAPILIGFFWMLSKLIEPFMVRLLQYPSWKDERLLVPVLSICCLLLVPAHFIFSQLLIRCGMVLLNLYLFFILWNTQKSDSILGRVWRIFMLFLLVFTIAFFVFPEHKSMFTWAQSGLWFTWTLIVTIALSPRSPRWYLRWLGLALPLLCTLLLLVNGDLVSPLTLCVVSFTLWASFTLWSYSGMYGAQMLPGALASLLFALSNQTQYHEAFVASALVMGTLPVFGWRRCNRRYTQKLAFCLQVDTENSAKSTLDSFQSMVMLFFGRWLASDLLSNNRSQPRLMKAMSLWQKLWLGKKGWRNCLRMALNSSPWSERLGIQDDSNIQVMLRMESPASLDLAKRIRIIRSQLCFKGFKNEEIELLAEYLEVAEYDDDTLLLEQGEDAHPYLEIVIKGRVLLERKKPGGGQSILAEIGPLESLRAEDLFKNTAYDFSARAIEKVISVRLYRQHVLAWVSLDPSRISKVIESVNLSDMIMKLSLFRDFSPSQVRLVMEKLKRKDVKGGIDVITQGDDGDEFYLLDRGKVEIIVNGHPVAQLGAGSYFGEIALLEKCKRTATVRTVDHSILYSLEQADFDRFFAAGRGALVLKNVSSIRAAEAVI
jgi:CRP-like cAMP-binding protein